MRDKQLPLNPDDLIGKKIRLKETADKNSVDVWGITPYVFTINNHEHYNFLPIDKRIRMYPEEEYPDGRVHALGAMIGYNKIRTLFELI